MRRRYDGTGTWLLLIAGAALLGAGIAFRIGGALPVAFVTTALSLGVFAMAYLKARR